MIDKLEMFMTVAKEGHFGHAAQSLGITQPTLSAGIKQLEEQLGVMLIFRNSRYGGLTPEGKRTLEWARRIVSDSRQLREEMRAMHHGLSGRLRIAAIPTAMTWAAKLITRFGEKHPNVDFTVLSSTSIEILQMIDDLEVDAGLTYLNNEPVGKVSTISLYDEQFMLVCREDHPLTEHERLDWKQLAGERLCLLTTDMQNRRIINRNLADAGITARAMIESNSTVSMIAHVLESNCVTLLPEDIATFLGEGKKLRLIRMNGPRPGHSVGLVAPYREPQTPVLAELMAEGARMARDRLLL